MSEITMYSPNIDGDKGNYKWAVSFDKTGKAGSILGFIGISQMDEHGDCKERVLLSPKQVKELIEFAKKRISIG